MLTHGRETTVTLHKASWTGSKISGSQNVDAQVSFASPGWFPISYRNPSSLVSSTLASLTLSRPSDVI